jgi:hypothetical protein
MSIADDGKSNKINKLQPVVGALRTALASATVTRAMRSLPPS